MREIKKILIEKKTGKKYFIKSLEDDFHTSAGVISAIDLNSGKKLVKSSKKESFIVLNPFFSDILENVQRGPQVITSKDIGLILAKTGVNKNSKVVDAGGGSGLLCFSLANVCKEVVVYEINPEHCAILEKNQQLLGLINVVLKLKDVSQGIAEHELDLITLDLPEPWNVTAHAEKALKLGGFLVVYLPNLVQLKTFVDSTIRTGITILETVELLERKWKIEDRIMRPEFQMMGHTGFLTFCRKM